MAGTPAGWYPDPTRRAEYRYWDGNAWTAHISRAGVQGSDSISDPAQPGGVAHPTEPVTAQSSGTETPPISPPPTPAPTWQPQPQKKAKWPWVLGGILGGLVIIGAGCAAILGLAVSSAVHHLNAEQRAHAITAAQFNAVPLGASEAAVVQQLGKQPEDAQHFVSRGVLTQQDVTSSCIYYNKSDGGFGPRYQFCFTNGALSSKNSY